MKDSIIQVNYFISIIVTVFANQEIITTFYFNHTMNLKEDQHFIDINFINYFNYNQGFNFKNLSQYFNKGYFYLAIFPDLNRHYCIVQHFILEAFTYFLIFYFKFNHLSILILILILILDLIHLYYYYEEIFNFEVGLIYFNYSVFMVIFIFLDLYFNFTFNLVMEIIFNRVLINAINYFKMHLNLLILILSYLNIHLVMIVVNFSHKIQHFILGASIF